MPLKTPSVIITTSPTLIVSGVTGNVSLPTSVLIYVPSGGQTVYIGGSDVTTAIGPPVTAGNYGPSIDLVAGDDLYGIIASGTQGIIVLLTRQ